MFEIPEEILNNGLHYNDLNIKQKYEVCQYWDNRLKFIQPCYFDHGFRRLFENAKKMKSRYAHLGHFGIINYIPESMDFRKMTDKEFAGVVIKNLYTARNMEIANTVSATTGIMPTSKFEREIMRLTEIIDKNLETEAEIVIELGDLVDKKEKRIKDLLDVIGSFIKDNKITSVEYVNRIREEEKKDKPDTIVYGPVVRERYNK